MVHYGHIQFLESSFTSAYRIFDLVCHPVNCHESERWWRHLWSKEEKRSNAGISKAPGHHQSLCLLSENIHREGRLQVLRGTLRK
jgi:hypothetical protein